MTAATDETVSRVQSRDGTEIGYWTTGAGPPLVLVHGTLGDHTRWAALLPHLESRFTVHAMDRRGRGVSGDQMDYDAAREFEDVAAVVDAVAEESGATVDVVGSSGGACFALSAAALTSNIRRLVLFEPPASGTEGLISPQVLEEMDRQVAADDREGILASAYRWIVGLTDEEIDHLRAQAAWPNRLAAAHTVPRELRIPAEKLFDPDQARKVSVPALVLVGSETPTTYRAAAGTVADTLPDGRLMVIEGQGHGAELLAPEVVAEPVLGFLSD